MRAFVTDVPTRDASPAVHDLPAHFAGERGLDLVTTPQRAFRLPDPTRGRYGRGDHNQGIGFLRPAEVDDRPSARAALTFTSDDGTGLLVASRPLASGEDDLAPRGDGRLDFAGRHAVVDIAGVPAYGNHAHPGGLQAHGDFVVVAMEQPAAGGRAAAYVLAVDGLDVRHVQTVPLGGSDRDARLDLDSACSAGFLRLSDGFLLAVSGADHGRGGVWFYDTRDPELTSSTVWSFVDFWSPARLAGGVCDIEDGHIARDCFAGGGGGTSLLADDSSAIYAVFTTGTDGWGKDDEYVQVMRVERPRADRVELVCVATGKKKLGVSAIRHPSFRWTGGADVTAGGQIVLSNTERSTFRDSGAWVDGTQRRSTLPAPARARPVQQRGTTTTVRPTPPAARNKPRRIDLTQGPDRSRRPDPSLPRDAS